MAWLSRIRRDHPHLWTSGLLVIGPACAALVVGVTLEARLWPVVPWDPGISEASLLIAWVLCWVMGAGWLLMRALIEAMAPGPRRPLPPAWHAWGLAAVVLVLATPAPTWWAERHMVVRQALSSPEVQADLARLDEALVALDALPPEERTDPDGVPRLPPEQNDPLGRWCDVSGWSGIDTRPLRCDAADDARRIAAGEDAFRKFQPHLDSVGRAMLLLLPLGLYLLNCFLRLLSARIHLTAALPVMLLAVATALAGGVAMMGTGLYDGVDIRPWFPDTRPFGRLCTLALLVPWLVLLARIRRRVATPRAIAAAALAPVPFAAGLAALLSLGLEGYNIANYDQILLRYGILLGLTLLLSPLFQRLDDHTRRLPREE